MKNWIDEGGVTVQGLACKHIEREGLTDGTGTMKRASMLWATGLILDAV